MPPTKNNNLTKRIISGAVGGPGTGRGLSYQIDYSILETLDLMLKACSAPLKRYIVRIEPRVVGLFEVTRWDLGIEPDDFQIEAKISPTKRDVIEWLEHVRQAAKSTETREFRFVYGARSTAILTAVRHLIRIAREASGREEFFERIPALEGIKDAKLVRDVLGPDAFPVLARMGLKLIPEDHLEQDIAHRTRMFSGERGDDLRRLLLDKFQHAIATRGSFHVDSLIEEARSKGIEIQSPPNIIASEYGPKASAALFVLQSCKSGLPVEVVATACDSTPSDLVTDLEQTISNGVVEAGGGLLSLSPLVSRLAHPSGDDLIARTLEALTDHISGDREGKRLGQINNALVLAQSCARSRPRVVATVFKKLDKTLKRRGDKHLILDVAVMSVAAARTIRERNRDDVDAEARALVCGVSWVYQRLPGYLEEAKLAYEHSCSLARKMGLDESLAFATKCLGRLHRLAAEELRAGDPNFSEYLALSEKRLSDAIKQFSGLGGFGPDDEEVGDCWSLIGRTRLVAADHEGAAVASRKAYRLLSGTNTKEEVDLLILIGEIEGAKSNFEGAFLRFDEALALNAGSEFSLSEMRARALRQRGLLSARVGRRSDAISDLRRAADIWNSLREFEHAAVTEWDLIHVRREISKDASRVLEKYPPIVRVIAVRRHLEKMENRRSELIASRAPTARGYWKRLIKEAEKDDALRNTGWHDARF